MQFILVGFGTLPIKTGLKGTTGGPRHSVQERIRVGASKLHLPLNPSTLPTSAVALARSTRTPIQHTAVMSGTPFASPLIFFWAEQIDPSYRECQPIPGLRVAEVRSCPEKMPMNKPHSTAPSGKSNGNSTWLTLEGEQNLNFSS